MRCCKQSLEHTKTEIRSFFSNSCISNLQFRTTLIRIQQHLPSLNLCNQLQPKLCARPKARGMTPTRSLPATSRERFLAVGMGPSFLRSRGLLRRSVTFCFSRERSFRLGSDAAQTQRGSTEFHRVKLANGLRRLCKSTCTFLQHGLIYSFRH